jgi:hypothetical protein
MKNSSSENLLIVIYLSLVDLGYSLYLLSDLPFLYHCIPHIMYNNEHYIPVLTVSHNEILDLRASDLKRDTC